MLDDDVNTFVHGALPPAPARVLEIGAGAGELAEAMRGSGYEVVAIDPAPQSPAVRPVALHELVQPPAGFDAAVAVVSLHHVDPLAPSCRRLAELVKTGGTLVVDEFDVETFDERAATWWITQRQAAGHEKHTDPDELVAELRAHLHSLRRLRETLGEWFRLEPTVRGPYLHRWHVPPGLRDAEAHLIAAGSLPPSGARVIGTRR